MPSVAIGALTLVQSEVTATVGLLVNHGNQGPQQARRCHLLPEG